MRPTDENQSTSMRPNLMSPRRTVTSGEDSILAMLEREPTRKRSSGGAKARLAWYGAGSVVALVLTGTLVWLAATNDGRQPGAQDLMLAEAAKPAQPQAAPPPSASMAGADAALRQVALAPAMPTAESGEGSAAIIVDQPPAADGVPPLRLLRPAPEPVRAQAAAPVRVPVPAAQGPARPQAKAASPARAAAAVPAPKPAVRPAAPPAKAKPVLLARNAVRPAQPKTQRGAGPARQAEAPVDADVALISAVIVHANGHAPEGSQMTELLCPNDNCQPRPARQ